MRQSSQADGDLVDLQKEEVEIIGRLAEINFMFLDLPKNSGEGLPDQKDFLFHTRALQNIIASRVGYRALLRQFKEGKDEADCM